MKVKEREEHGGSGRIWSAADKEYRGTERLKKKKAGGRVSHSPAACSGNSFGTQSPVHGEQPEVLFHPNASRLLYELFHPHCWNTGLENNNSSRFE